MYSFLLVRRTSVIVTLFRHAQLGVESSNETIRYRSFSGPEALDLVHDRLRRDNIAPVPIVRPFSHRDYSRTASEPPPGRTTGADRPMYGGLPFFFDSREPSFQLKSAIPRSSLREWIFDSAFLTVPTNLVASAEKNVRCLDWTLRLT